MSPLTWDVAFDPILWITEVAGSCEALGYVDDLLAKVVGPGQTILIYLLSLAATKMAGSSPGGMHRHCRSWNPFPR